VSDVRLQRKIGLGGAVFLLVGNIIGASIFILPGQLTEIAGPAVFLAYLLAAIPAICYALMAAQIGGVLPVSASDYIFSSIALHPSIGFIKVWAAMLGAMVGGPILAYGFANYMAYFLPDVSKVSVAIGIVVFVTVLNLLGIRTSVRAQVAMVVFFVSCLLVLGIGGLFHIDTTKLQPMIPMGWGSVLAAAVPAYFSYTGFTMLLSFTEESKDPARNIPLSVLLTFIIVSSIYTLITPVVPGLVPWRELATMAAPVSAASATFLPQWFSVAITVSALMAAGTSINVLFITASRSCFGVARSGIFPEILSHVSARSGEPAAAIVFVAIVTLVGVAIQGTIVQYASITVIGWMLYGIIYGSALIRMPAALPEHYANAEFRMPPKALYVIGGTTIVIAIVFISVAVRDNLVPALIYLALVGSGGIYYVFRKRYLDAAGIALDDLLSREKDEAARATWRRQEEGS
jgi:APA family basic amino acid/polyamine antiporter